MSHMPYNAAEADDLDPHHSTHHVTESRLSDHIARVEANLAKREVEKIKTLSTYAHPPIGYEELREE